MKHIKSFYFQNAKYLISDGVGNSVYMIMNYKDKDCGLEVVEKVDGGLENLKAEALRVAKKLLIKKHNVNFVERLEV